ESGVERALWALTKGDADPAANGALVDPLPAPVPAPYNGTYVAVGVGGFKVTVTNGPAVNERTITSLGYVPNDANPHRDQKDPDGRDQGEVPRSAVRGVRGRRSAQRLGDPDPRG